MEGRRDSDSDAWREQVTGSRSSRFWFCDIYLTSPKLVLNLPQFLSLHCHMQVPNQIRP